MRQRQEGDPQGRVWQLHRLLLELQLHAWERPDREVRHHHLDRRQKNKPTLQIKLNKKYFKSLEVYNYKVENLRR